MQRQITETRSYNNPDGITFMGQTATEYRGTYLQTLNALGVVVDEVPIMLEPIFVSVEEKVAEIDARIAQLQAEKEELVGN